ncbi:MAG: hypothetical protein HY722_11055 [Planctomycetes bacterium]|nr:hypothetical protein [Planctomycetota bacterium]
MAKDKGERPQVPDFLPEDVSRQLRRLSPSGSVWAGVGLLVVAAGFLVAMVGSGYTHVAPGQVAVVVNNLTGSETLQLTPGTVIHLPLGITQVYRLDKTEKVFTMTAEPGRGDRPGLDNVRIKTKDGSNVYIDVEIRYHVDPAKAGQIVRRLGKGAELVLDVVRAYARSVIRDEFGRLSIEEVSVPATRLEKVQVTRTRLAEALAVWGIQVTSVSAINFAFNEQYVEMIKRRKEADQIARNQREAQLAAAKDRERALQEAGREKNVALTEEQGLQRRRLIAAEALREQMLARAQGEAVKLRKEGDRSHEVARLEAEAVRTEGLTRATGIAALARAFEKGGLALVREALARKYAGCTLSGRPYSLDSHVDRVRMERAPSDEDARRAAAAREAR